jgi:hypothetical protein
VSSAAQILTLPGSQAEMTSFAASFEQGRCVFDEDILQNSEAAVETLVRVGMSIGRAVLPSP